MPTTAIAIAGVTGKLGRLIAAALLAIPNVTVHGICHTPSKLLVELSSNPHFKTFQAECHETEKLRLALRGTSRCTCTYLGDLAAVFLDGQKTLIDACVAEGVERYLASDFNFDFRELSVGDIPLKDHQVLIKGYLEEREEKGLLRGMHVLCGIFLESLFAPFFPVYDGETGVLRVWGTGSEVLEMTNYEDEARFVAAVAVDEGAVGFLGFIGDRKTPKEIVQIYQNVYSEDLKLSIEGSKQELLAAAVTAQREDPANLAWLFKLLYFYILNGQAELKDLDVDHVKDLKPLSLEQFFEKHERETLPLLGGVMEF